MKNTQVTMADLDKLINSDFDGLDFKDDVSEMSKDFESDYLKNIQ